MRVLVQRGMVFGLGMSRGGSSHGGGDRLAHFVNQKPLKPFVPKELLSAKHQRRWHMPKFSTGAVIFLVIFLCALAQESPSQVLSNKEWEERKQEIEEEVNQELARFELFNECKPIWPAISGQNAFGGKEELPESVKQAVQNAVEIRLRSARLYAKHQLESGLATLRVFVHISEGSHDQITFSLFVGYNKPVWDRFGNGSRMTTWEKNRVMLIYGGPADIPLNALQLIDTFLVEYLRVNEEACIEK